MAPPADRRAFAQAVARVIVQTSDGEQRGTAFLVGRRHALTALHVVADRHAEKPQAHGPIHLHFPGFSVEATLLFGDRRADFAVLELGQAFPDPSESVPLRLLPLTEEDLGKEPVAWLSLGFPDARADGLWVAGQVRSTLSHVGPAPAIQLYSDEAAAGRGAPLAGLSGAPVLVDGTVAGLLRWATLDEEGKSVAGSVFACPSAPILEKLETLSIAGATPRCPYPGLVSFSVEQGALFFGRRTEIDWLLENVRRHNLLLVIGASGSGKTSLVQAGLLPQLPREFLPILWRAGRSERMTPESVVEALRRADAKRLVLVIDQLEETFLLRKRPEQQVFFENVLSLAALQHVAVVLVLRADLFPELLASRLWPIDPARRLEVAPLCGERLLEAIVEPANRLGLHIESNLLERLRSEVADEPGALPLLQETLVLLWERRQGRRLTLTAYDDLARLVEPSLPGARELVSGLGAALTLHAEEVFSKLTDSDKRLCRRTLLRLTQFGEGRPHTRRQQAWTALFSADDDRNNTESLLERLVRARLITTSVGQNADGGKTQPGKETTVLVDLSHEIMLRAWPRLRMWLSELRHAERVRRRLEQQADDWQRLSSRGGGLLDAVQAREAEQFLQSPDAQELGTSEVICQLVRASRENADHEAQQKQAAAVEKARQQLLLAQLREKSRAKLWKTAATLTFLLAGSATGLSLWALRERKWAKVRAEQAAHFANEEAQARKLALEKERLATLRFLVAQAQVRQDSAPDLAALLAVAAQKLLPSAESQGLLAELIQRQAPVVRVFSGSGVPVHALATSAAWGSVDKQRLAVGFDDGQVWLLDAQTGVHVGKPVRVQPGAVLALAFSPDGTRLFAGGEDKQIRAFSASGNTAGEPIGLPLAGHEASIKALSVGTDGRYLVSGDEKGVIRFWDAQTGEVAGPTLHEHEKTVTSLSHSPDGKWLLSGSDDQTVRLWDAKTSRRLAVFTEVKKRVRAVTFVGKIAAAGDWDGDVWFWELPGGKPLGSGFAPAFANRPTPRNRRGHGLSVTGLAVARSGALFSVSWEGTLAKWLPGADLPTSIGLLPRRGALQHAQWSTQEQTLWTATDEGKLLEIDVSERSPLQLDEQVFPRELSCLALSSDGTQLAVGGWDKQIELWNTQGRRLLRKRRLLGHEASVSAVAFSPDGKRLASAGFDKTVRVWDIQTGQHRPVGTNGPVRQEGQNGPDGTLTNALMFSPDGTRLAAGGFDFGVRLFDLSEKPSAVLHLIGHHGAVWGLDYSPDGKRLCTASQDQSVRVWDTQTGGMLKELLSHGRAVTACRFFENGDRILSSSEDQTLRIWDWAQGKTLGEPLRGHTARITGLAVENGGLHAVSASEDRTLRIWDLRSQQAVGAGLWGHQKMVTATAVALDGKTAYSASHDGTVRVWDLDVTSWLVRACRLAGRNLTPEERERFLGETPLPTLCPPE